MSAMKNLDAEIRSQFPGRNNAGLRKMIRAQISEGLDVRHLARVVALDALGRAKLDAIAALAPSVERVMERAESDCYQQAADAARPDRLSLEDWEPEPSDLAFICAAVAKIHGRYPSRDEWARLGYPHVAARYVEEEV